jgi:radical SAM protein with 4Fe4S-binding SPASM domain
METYQLLAPLLESFANFELGINSVLCAANQEEMAETISWVGELEDLGTHTVSLIRGRVRDQELKEVEPEVYRQVAELLESRLKSEKNRSYRFGGARLKAAQDILQRRLIHRTMIEKRRLLPCYAGLLSLVVTETGDLFPCESFSLKMGNLREHDFDIRQVLSSRQGAEILAGIARRQCFCTHECSFMLNILFNPRLYPWLFREYLQLNG